MGQPTEGVTTVEGQFLCRFAGEKVVETWHVSFARNTDDYRELS